MSLRELLQRVTSSKYTRMLEADLARMRAENRALLNSILGIAGVPPLIATENDVSASPALQKSAVRAALTGKSAIKTSRSGRAAPAGVSGAAVTDKVPPMRRRSWHQIYRMLEINSARKKETGEIH